jgi:hypothetical protein
MREGIKRNIKSEIPSEVKREAKNILVSVSKLLPTDDTIPQAGYLAPAPSSFILLNLGERENTA